MKIRGTKKPNLKPQNVVLEDWIEFRLTNKKCRPRQTKVVFRSVNGILLISAYCPTNKGRVFYKEEDVNPNCWKKIFTEEVLNKLPIKKTPPMIHGYNLNDRYFIEDNKNNYTVGCQTISKKRMILLCKAILKDQGYLVMREKK